jgi:hypothetical protein
MIDVNTFAVIFFDTGGNFDAVLQPYSFPLASPLAKAT